MDPLSAVLSLFNTREVLSGHLHAGQDWCIQSAGYSGLRFGVILEGDCLLQVANVSQPERLAAGDCYLLTDGRPYRIGSDLNLPRLAMDEVFGRMVGSTVRLGDSVETRLIGGRFTLEGAQASFLLGSLPPVIHIAAAHDTHGRLRWLLENIVNEQYESQPGAASMMEHLTHAMLIQIVRHYLHAAQGEGLSSWLAALADPGTGAALALLHGDPARRWSLTELAREVGMSRSAFAARFRAMVGETPVGYLVAWRMRLAAQALVRSSATISVIGFELGYGTESAFSAAFKRVMGCSPRAYRKSGGSAGGGEEQSANGGANATEQKKGAPSVE